MDGNAVVFRKTTGHENSCQNQLVIIFPDCRVLRVFARSLFVIFAVLALPWLGCFQYVGTAPPTFPSGENSGVAAVTTEEASPEQLIPAVFRDLLDEGLFKLGEYALFIGGFSEAAEIRRFIDGGAVPPLEFIDINENGGRFVVDSTVDFAFTANGFNSLLLIERVLRVGGVAALRFSSATDSVSVPPNFKIVYLRHFHAPNSDTVIAIRKMNERGDAGRAAGSAKSSTDLCPTSETKRRAIRDLEDVLLEPPRESWVDSRGYLKRVKYLPDLTGDDLASFPRHVYVEVGRGRHADGVGEWFLQNYPSRGRDFDVYVLGGDLAGAKYEPAVTWARKGLATGMQAMRLSDWLKRNIREEEYVVMKMQVGKGDSWGVFEVVREMVRSKAVCLVDELFLVCDHEWEVDGTRRRSRSSRAYWECLALYGMLREEGVAVHQWWD